MTLKEQVVQKVSGLSDDELIFLLDMIEKFTQAETKSQKSRMADRRIGIAKGQDLYDNEYDFDEMNPEIEKMFGVTK